MSTIKITAASLVSLFCHFKYLHEVQENTSDEVSIKRKVPIHEDLRNSFKALNPHLAAICEEVAHEQITDIENIPEIDETEGAENDPIAEKLSKFFVTGFQIEGSGENEGVVLTGSKTLSTGDEVALKTPRIKWEDTKYHFIQELRIAVDAAISEVEQYMGGKQAPRIIQTEMDFDEDETK